MSRRARSELYADAIESPLRLEAGGLEVVVALQARSEVSEDALLVYELGPSSAVIAVCDGVGGQAHGDRASRGTLRKLAEALDPLRELADAGEMSDASQVRTVILDAIEDANSTVLRIGSGAATTLALVDCIDGVCRSYHVGDSGVLHFDRRGDLKRRTFGHGPAGARLAAGLVTEEEARELPDANIVHNVIGDEALRVEVGAPLKISASDSVLVASDGLLDHMTSVELAEMLSTGDGSAAVAACVETSLDRMHHSDWGHADDLSMCLIRPLK